MSEYWKVVKTKSKMQRPICGNIFTNRPSAQEYLNDEIAGDAGSNDPIWDKYDVVTATEKEYERFKLRRKAQLENKIQAAKALRDAMAETSDPAITFNLNATVTASVVDGHNKVRSSFEFGYSRDMVISTQMVDTLPAEELGKLVKAAVNIAEASGFDIAKDGVKIILDFK